MSACSGCLLVKRDFCATGKEVDCRAKGPVYRLLNEQHRRQNQARSPLRFGKSFTACLRRQEEYPRGRGVEQTGKCNVEAGEGVALEILRIVRWKKVKLEA